MVAVTEELWLQYNVKTPIALFLGKKIGHNLSKITFISPWNFLYHNTALFRCVTVALKSLGTVAEVRLLTFRLRPINPHKNVSIPLLVTRWTQRS